MIPKDILIYESYIDGQMTKRPFITKGHETKEWMELVHANMCEPFNVHAKGVYGYFISSIDE